MSSARFGKLKPVYEVLLNPHAQIRLTKCAHCDRLTYPRKFSLLLGVMEWGPYAQGKTCKYCSKCKLIMVDQGELESELFRACSAHAPQSLGKQYILIGVVDMKSFREGLAGARGSMEEMEAMTSDFKKQHGLGLQLGGWYKKGTTPPTLPGFRTQRVPASAPTAG